MGENLFNVFLSTLKSRLSSIVSKLRLWTSWSYIKARLTGLLRDFFSKVLDVRPKNKNDYYTIFGWMVSKKLAYAIVIVVGILSIWYIGANTKIFSSFTKNGGMRTYDYNSVLLRLANDRVRIRGKSGYLAYEGEVSKGYVTGKGSLYSSDKVLLYNGNFEKNKYEGDGTQYYDSGVMHYTGSFHENLYEGSGKLYRKDWTEEYIGEFLRGMKEGKGTLYDTGSKQIYTGSFSADDIVYSEMLGKNAEEIRQLYMGKQILYEPTEDVGDMSVVIMQDIGAMYVGVSDGSASDDAEKAESIYVLKGTFRSGVQEANTIEEVAGILGDPVYEGNSAALLPEAVAINTLNRREYTLNGSVDMDTTVNYSDDIVVNDFQRDYGIYIYSFQRGSLIYSFVCKGRNGNFDFYEISEASEEAA